jgi:hypothetical protein
MKTLSVILVVLLIALSVFAVFRISGAYVESHQAAWQMDSTARALANAQLYQVEAQEAARRAIWFTEFYRFLFVVIVCVGVAGAAVYYWKQYDQRKESWARAVDGNFALSTFKSTNGQMYVTDINKATFGVFGFNKTTGELTTDAPMIGPDRQLDYAKSVQKTRTTSAMMTGDSGPKYAAHAKLLAGAYDRNETPQLPMADENSAVAPVATWQVLDAKQAFEQSTQSEWILGQNKLTGDVFKFTPRESFGIVGSPGVGKTTYAGQLVMALAIKSGYRVIVFDAKGGADFSRFAPWAEFAAIDYTNVMGYLNVLTAEMERRQAILNQHSANSIWELRGKNVAIPKPILCLADEFGAVAAGMKSASRAQCASFEMAIGNLLRLGRSAGIFMAFCDQNPSAWCSTMRGVLTTNICFRLGGAVGNSVSEYNLNQLARVGEFQVQGQRYSGFPTWEVIDQLLPDVASYKKSKALLTDTSITERGEYRGQTPTPKHDTSIDTSTGFTPVDDTSINTSIDTNDTNDTSIKQPLLTGKPVSAKDKNTVRNVHAVAGSINETCRLVWGAKTPSRAQWVKEVLAGEVQQ